ncbi:saccharopine dehydrogenase [Pseudonocardiaceae bacterium YIM PH 21723]|nr:saccharopine dehydrogenase [Pseudonocardiaceae bacterium YIM PH 21723]
MADVHWIGAGMSSGSGLNSLCDTNRVLLWHRSTQRAEQALAERGLTGRAEPRALDGDRLAAEIRPGDVVVSMLPATEHPGLLRTAIAGGAHFACTSYTSPELASLAEEAAGAGLTVLTEAGLDPGIDHLAAHVLRDRARAAVGESATGVRLTSYCGGIPAEVNEFRYRFSWAPRGVLTALLSPASYLRDGQPVRVERPWTATSTVTIDGEPFEVYPNRDSLPFIRQYGLPEGWQLDEFVRGTLRHSGWLDAWAEVFEVVTTGDDTRITELATRLAKEYPTTDTDRDRVVLVVALELDGWTGRFLLDVTGDERESAMARCVSQPLAFGIGELLAGRLPTGLVRAGDGGAELTDRWLEHLTGQGLSWSITQSG